MAVSPPRPALPPLNALRAFEAAARLGGFARAAEELNVTPAAVAQQVKHLEQWAGVDLFRRTARGVVLTEKGVAVAGDLTRAFDGLGQAAQRLRSFDRHRVHIAALPSVAQLWLGPRLPDLRRALPDIDISVTALESAPNLAREGFDITLFLEDRPHAGALARDVLLPVAAPLLAGRLATPSDVAAQVALSDSAWPGDWPRWRRAAGLEDPGRAPAGPVYSLYALAVEAALAGGGVLMGHDILVRAHLASGALVRCPGPKVALDKWLVLRRAPDAGTAARQVAGALGAGSDLS